MNSSELYDTLVSLDEKYTEEAETFLFTNNTFCQMLFGLVCFQ